MWHAHKYDAGFAKQLLVSKTAPGVFTSNNQQLVSGSTTRNNMPTLTNTSLMSMRQQMDEGNHDMVNMLTQ
jgi:hypothetical protein